MPIIVKGEMIVKSVEKKAPPTGKYRWDNDKKELVEVVKESVPQPIVRNEAIKETVEEPSKYHHQLDGDLHKLLNKKSEYLKDMLDFES